MRPVAPAVSIAVALLVLAGCGHAGHATNPRQPQALVSTQPKPAPAGPGAAPASPRAPAAVATRPTPATGALASPSESPKPSAAPLAPVAKKIPRLAPDAAPRILDVAVSETTVQPGDRVIGSVVTSSNVASVEARIGGYAVNLVKVGVGKFALTYTVGPLPWFIRGNFTMEVIARNTRGDAVTRAIPLTVR